MKRVRLALGVAPLLSAGILLAACGGGPGKTAVTVTVTTSEAAAPTNEEEPSTPSEAPSQVVLDCLSETESAQVRGDNRTTKGYLDITFGDTFRRVHIYFPDDVEASADENASAMAADITSAIRYFNEGSPAPAEVWLADPSSDDLAVLDECYDRAGVAFERDEGLSVQEELEGSAAPEEEPSDQPAEPAEPTEPAETVSQEQARLTAEDYLDSQAFSRKGLIKQLKYEGFSTKDARYAVDAVSPNWKEQAALMAQDYLDSQAFSSSGLIHQLKYEGFTTAQAEYGVNQTGL